MLDRIIAYDKGYPIYLSDIYPYEDFIGIVKSNGEVVFYQKGKGSKMKFKTTKKAMKENYNTILKIGYCNIQNLLQYEDAIAYSTRAEGWACDYYKVGNVIICEGYAPIGKSVSYDLQKKYNDLAEEIRYNNDVKWEDKKELLHDLLVQFVNEVTKGRR